MKITLFLFQAFLKCPTKCWLRSKEEPATGNAYAAWVQVQTESYRANVITRLRENITPDESAMTASLENLKSAKLRIAFDLVLESQNLKTQISVVERTPPEGRGKAAKFIPIHFIFTNKLEKDDKLLLAFDALILSEALEREVSLGKIIHGDDHATLKVKTSALSSEVQKYAEKISSLVSNPSPPDLVLNRHCAECEFQSRCRQKAIETDDLSLLAGMSAKERQQLRNKGIFTVTQLSYTFRPRHRPKQMRDKREKYHHSLKALAIREKKIHIVGSPEIKIEGTPVYLDVEGLPDRDFYYLIGLRIGRGESAVQHSLWADTIGDEGKIWREFLGILETVEKPVLIHYGSYEKIFFRRMMNQHESPGDGSTSAKAITSAINLLSVLFAQIYFPVWSNGLKDVAGHLGYQWSANNPTGTQTIIWRYQWEKSGGSQDKTGLVAYNAQDCEALEVIAATVKRLNLPVEGQEIEWNQHPEAVSAESLVEQSSLFRRFASPIAELELINMAARWNYQRDRIYVRTNEKIRMARRRQRGARKLLKPNKVVVIENPLRCPKCHRSTKHWPAAKSTLYDIHFSSGGMKRWIVQYNYRRTGCEFCRVYFGRPEGFRPHSKYGRNLLALIAFQVAGLCMPQRTVRESLNSLLGFKLSQCTVNNLKASVARCYIGTKESILQRILAGKMIQADETRISVKGKIGYVWVLTSLDAVAYIHTETREGERIQGILSEFKGVLVSDFYAVYDSITCPQQKCLIHLLRDLNDEVLNAPYDEEVKQIVVEFSQLLKPIVDTIDRYGLKRHFLRKHKHFVDRFFRQLFKREPKSQAAMKIKQRLEKNRDKLFTFLNYDSVPWNNNNAEHAIKAFARLRRVIEGLSTLKGLDEYLTLLSVGQTCKYIDVDFLDFLRSGEKDVHAFVERRRARMHRSPESQGQNLGARKIE